MAPFWSRVAIWASMLTVPSCASHMSPAPRVRTITLDEVAIRVVTAGVEARAPGVPLVVFESGGGTPLETWDGVLGSVARFVPAMAYDRSGTGESEWDGLPPTPGRTVARLHALLRELEAAPPYLVVGHSWGGALARYFAATFPNEVAGVLFLDPTDITAGPEDELDVFESIGAGAPGRDAFYALMEQSSASAPPHVRAESDVLLSLLRADPAARGLGPMPHVPASVILAGEPTVLPGGILPFDTDAYARATQERRVTRLRSWANEPMGGRFMVADGVGHFIHVERPELVVSYIRELVDAVR
jgi:pimeloyl-ACP methyl ester carboxylesterase